MNDTKTVQSKNFEILLPELKLIENDCYYSEEYGGNLPRNSYDIPHWVAIAGGLTTKLVPFLAIATAFDVVATVREIEDLDADSLQNLRQSSVLFENYDARLLRAAGKISIKTASKIISLMEISLKEAKFVGVCLIIAKMQLPFSKIEQEQLLLPRIVKLFSAFKSLRTRRESEQKRSKESLLNETQLEEKLLGNSNIIAISNAIAFTTAEYITEIIKHTTVNEVASRLYRTLGLTMPPNLTKPERFFFRKTQAQHNYICDNWGRDNTFVTREMMYEARSNIERKQNIKLAMFDVDHYSMREEYWSDDYALRQAGRLEKLGAPQRIIDDLRNPKPVIEIVANFLSYIEYMGGWKEIEEGLKKRVNYAPVGVILDLKALEKLLSTPQEKDVYAKLVAYDFNWSLDDPSDENAKAHLQKLADMVRQVLGDLAPPKAE